MWRSDVADKFLSERLQFFFYSYSRFFRVQPVQIHFQKKETLQSVDGPRLRALWINFIYSFFSAPVDHKEPPRWKSKNIYKYFFFWRRCFQFNPLALLKHIFAVAMYFSLFWSFESVRSTYDTFFCVLWRRSTTIRFFCEKKEYLRSVLARDTIRSLPYFPPNTFFCVHIIRNCFFFWLSLFRALTESIGGSSGFAHEDWWWRQ